MSKQTKVLEVEVRTAAQGSFIPMTWVPDGLAGKKVRLIVVDEATHDESGEALPRTMAYQA
jgi:hypothetical protein